MIYLGQRTRSLASRLGLAGRFARFGTSLLATGFLALGACEQTPAGAPPASDAPDGSTPVTQPNPPGSDPNGPAACAPYSIVEGPVDLFERVTLVGLTTPEEIEGIRIAGRQSDLPVFLGQADDSSFFFTAPLHPDLAGEAGKLKVWLDLAPAAASCDLGTIEVSALPPSGPNEAEEVLALLEQAARSMLASYGFVPESFEPLAPGNSAMDLALARLHRALFDEQSPTRVAAVRSNLAALSEPDRSFVGAILKETRFRETLQSMIALYEQPAFAAAPLAGSSKGARFQSAPIAQQAQQTRNVESAGDCYLANVAPEVIGTAAELSDAMIRAKEAVEVTARWKSTRDFSSAMLNVLGFTPAGPVASVVSLLGGGVILYMDLSERYTATLLPSTLDEVRLQASVNPINEDYMDESSSLPVWQAHATASSQGADLEKDLFKVALAIAGAVPVSNTASLALTDFGYATNHAFESIPDDAECFSIPAHTWSHIDVTGREWLEEDPRLSGTSFDLQAPNEIVPVDIGATNIEIVLSREKFPCELCPVGSRSDDIDITVREKQVVFSRSAFPIPDPSGLVTVTGAIQNSSRPDLWSIDYDDLGVQLVAVDRREANFSVTFQGRGDPNAFPVQVRVKSESTKLPGQSANPWFDTAIVLDQTVEIEHDGDDCVGTDEAVGLTATVIGLAPQDVSWQVSTGASLVPVSPTEAVFSASNPGIYTITAASTTDPAVEGSIEIAVQTCDFDLYVNSRARVSTTKSDSHPSCGAGSHPDTFIEEEQHGLPWGITWVDTGTFRNPERWTGGGSFAVDLLTSETISSTYEIGGQCYTPVALAEGQMAGALSSRDGGRVVDIDLQMGGRQNCAPVAGGVEDCKAGSAELSSMMHFVLEHAGSGTQSYDYAVNLTCTADTGGVPVQMITSVVIMDSSGGWQNDLGQHVLDAQTLGALSRVAFLRCAEGQPLSVQETFDFIDYLPPGASSNAGIEPYTAAVMVSFSAHASTDPANMLRFETIHSSSVQGSISLRPATAP